MSTQVKTLTSTGAIREIHYYGITGQSYTDYSVVYGANGKAASATYSNGYAQSWSYNADGSLLRQISTGITGQRYTATDTFFGGNGKALSQTWTNDNSVVQTESWNSDGSVHDIHYYGVTGQSYTDYQLVYGDKGKVSTAVYSNGLTQTWAYNADGSLRETISSGIIGQTFTATDTVYGANGKPASLTWSNGDVVIKTQTWNADGSVHDVHYYGINDKAYTDYGIVYGANGKQSSISYSNGMTQSWSYNADGSIHDTVTTGIAGQRYTTTDTAYGANGKAISQIWSNGDALVQTQHWNSDGSVHDIHYYGVTGQAYTDYEIVYGANGKAASATYSNGNVTTWTYNADGSLYELVSTGIAGQRYTATDTIYGANGKAISQTWINGNTIIKSQGWNADGSVRDIHNYGITGQDYTDYDIVYGANGKQASISYSNGMRQTWNYNADGSAHELITQGISGQSYTATDIIYGANGRVVSQTWSNDGALIKLQTWNADGSVRSIDYPAAQDITAPVVSIQTPGAHLNHAMQSIAGTGEAGTIVKIFDGTTQLGTAMVAANGTWSTSVTLSDGAHSLVAKNADAAGNVGVSAAVSYVVDTVAPVIKINGQGGLSNHLRQAVSGSVGIEDAGTTIKLFEGTSLLGVALVGADGTWSTTVALNGDGSHSLVAQDVDAVGNVGVSGPVTYVVDTTAPVVSISNAGGAISQAQQTLSGHVGIGDAGLSVKIMDGTTQLGTAVADSNGNWSTSVTLNGGGTHSLIAQTTDLAGNVGTSAAVTFDLPHFTVVAADPSAAFMMGVNLPQAAFAQGTYNGVANPAIWPSTSDLDYFASKGLGLVRVAFTWEQMQTSLGGPLDPVQLAKLEKFIDDAAARGLQVIVDLHSFGSYNGNPLGSSAVSIASFQDFWTKLAGELKDHTNIYGYDIMNEPHGLPNTSVWPAAAQAAVNGIRSVDTTHTIIVEGDAWATAAGWQVSNGNLHIVDPVDNLMYQAHLYFDYDGSGTYKGTYDDEAAYPMIGVDRLQSFADWLTQNNAKGFIGEFGVPNNDPRWLTVLDNLLAEMKKDGISGTYWAAGNWSNGYPLSVEPINGQDAVQLATLLKYGANGSYVDLHVSDLIAVETGTAVLPLTPGLSVHVSDTAAHIAALTTAQIAGMSALGITSVSADAMVTLTAAQQKAFGAASIAVSQIDSTGSEQVWSWNIDGSLHDVYHHDVVGTAYGDYYVLYANGAPTVAHYSTGVTEKWTYYAASLGYSYTTTDQFFTLDNKPISQTWLKGTTVIKSEAWNSDGSVHDIHYYGITGQAYTDYDIVYGANGKPASAAYSNGMTQTWTYNADGTTHDMSYTNVTGSAYTASATGYASNGSVAVQETMKADGSETLRGYGNGTIYEIARTGESVTSADGQNFHFAASTNTTLTGGGSNEVFVFNAGFGQSKITDFVPNALASSTHDIIKFNSGAFSDYNDLLSHATQSGSNTIITDHYGDVLTLQGVVKANLTAADFMIHA